MNFNTGLIFDIQRVSLNDGPGIRTTIFLKGCSLKCEWCHNPESQSFKPQLSFNAEKCINCLECVKVCPNEAHKVNDGRHFIDWNICDTRGKCVTVCSSNALQIIGVQKTVEEIVSEVKNDIKYYVKTGGGVTISGGEPLAQFNFTKDLLIEFKRNNIHTCVDTCGFAKQEHYKEIIPYTDLFLFDYKITDNIFHKKYTGVKNSLILSNLDYLYKSGAKIILRCPVIPGINDTEDHLNGIINLMRKYPNLNSVELLPYHNMGKDKAARIGKEYEMMHLSNPEELEKQSWVNFFKTENMKVVCG